MIGTVYKYISINVRAVQRAESHGFYISKAPNDCCFESILFKGLNGRNFSVLVVKKALVLSLLNQLSPQTILLKGSKMIW